MKRLNKIAITTGDRNGIGFEVAAKALATLGKKPTTHLHNSLFFLFRHRSQEKMQGRYFKLIDETWLRLTFFSLDEAVAFLNTKNLRLPKNTLIDLSLSSGEASWVVQAATFCKKKYFKALVTGPLSKTKTVVLQGRPLGHTGIFRQLFPKKKLFMSFVGKHFNVLLATDHLPLSKVESSLLRSSILPVFSAAKEFKKTFLSSSKKIAVLGLNPHAGENNLIGKTESKLFSKLPKDFYGPLVPDAAFLKHNWNKYGLFVCLYHDQGLIPFKMQHGQNSGVHITLGLPFVRTSVDHGTAFDIFNKHVADHSSMLEAIQLCVNLQE